MKNSTAVAIRSVLTLLVIGTLAVLVGLTLPSKTFAAEVSVQTAQLLPPGSNTCAPLPVSGFTPYVYNGALHAFEFSVSDSSYVAIAGSAGNTSIPFNQMTRRIEASGTLRVHADMATTPIRGSLTVNVTMLSSKGAGQPVCISIISTTIDAEGVLQATPPPTTPVPSPTPAGGTGVSKPKPPTPSGGVTKTPPPSTESGKATTTTGTKATSAAVATAQNILKDICSAGGAFRLWLVLLVVYALIVLIAIVGQPQMPPAMRTQEWIATAIVVPFLLLFGLWYFAESCRTSAWIPVIATLIALAGLSAAFWERKDTKVINLPGEKT